MAAKKSSGSPQSRARKNEQKRERAQQKRRAIWIRVGAVAVVAAAAVIVVVAVANRRAESARDLSQIGQGVPAVVQVHDVTCPICTDLRANVRRIEREYDDATLLVRVADIRDEDGLAFATRYTGARRQTLLFLDGEGNLVDERAGLLEVESLRTLFDAHAEAY